MAKHPKPPRPLIDKLVQTNNVVAIGLGGSQASGQASDGSDIDLYVLTSGRIDPETRRSIIEPLADDPYRVDLAIPYWGDEDAFGVDGTWIDLAFFDANWFFEEIDSVLTDHRVSQGYTTSFVHTLAHMLPLHDPEGILEVWKRRTPLYPDELAEKIITHNYHVSCVIHACYRNQIERAVTLGDPVAVNHRVAAFLACVTDIAFAHLRMWHPGEKRQLQYLKSRKEDLPREFVAHIRTMLLAAAPDRMTGLMPAVDAVVDDITSLVE